MPGQSSRPCCAPDVDTLTAGENPARLRAGLTLSSLTMVVTTRELLVVK